MSGWRTAALFALFVAGSVPVASGLVAAQPAIVVTASIAPPPLPIYLQPPIPGLGYLWSPGYWDWDPAFGYYWVPGTWVLPPRPNLLWTPAYWGWSDGVYFFHRGYWGPQVGFYGGIVYGFGYTGQGFQGGYWNGGSFFYNRSVTNITNVNITNVYNQTVVVNNATANASYNGGAGGTTARPTPQQTELAQLPHEPVTPAQTQQAAQARTNPTLRLSANGGVPPIAATPRPSAFSGAGVIAALPVSRRPPPNATAIQRPATAGLPAAKRPAAATPANALPTGNALPAAGPLPAESKTTSRPAGAQPVIATPGPNMTQTPARPLAMPPSLPAPTLGSMAGRPDAAALAKQRAAALQQRAIIGQQQRAEQMARQQAAQQQQMQQRVNVMAQRAARPPRMAPPRMARPAPQRFAARPAPRRGRH